MKQEKKGKKTSSPTPGWGPAPTAASPRRPELCQPLGLKGRLVYTDHSTMGWGTGSSPACLLLPQGSMSQRETQRELGLLCLCCSWCIEAELGDLSTAAAVLDTVFVSPTTPTFSQKTGWKLECLLYVRHCGQSSFCHILGTSTHKGCTGSSEALCFPATTRLLTTGKIFPFILPFKDKVRMLFSGTLYVRKYGMSLARRAWHWQCHVEDPVLQDSPRGFCLGRSPVAWVLCAQPPLEKSDQQGPSPGGESRGPKGFRC